MPNILKQLIPSPEKGFVPLTVAAASIGPYWAIEPHYGETARKCLAGMDYALHAAEFAQFQASVDDDSSNASTGYDVDENGIATISMVGVMTKRPTSWGRGCSTLLTRLAVRRAQADERVKACALIIDSPGGNIDGTADLAQDVKAFSAVKPIGAYIEDTGCSAAYFVAANCDFIYCNSSAKVGSIGTMIVLCDSSKAATMEGLQYKVISSSPLKGAWADGVPISQAFMDDTERIINEINALFLSAVQAGRSMNGDELSAVADARIHVGQNCVPLKLVDKVATIDQFYARLGDPSAGTDALNDESTGDDTDDEPEDPDAPDTDSAATTAAISGIREIVNMSNLRQQFAALLSRTGKNKEAAAVLGAADDTEDAIVAKMNEQATADAQVPAKPELHTSLAGRTASDKDILAACHGNGIQSAKDVEKVIDLAKLGETYATEIREDFKVQAVRALGAEVGKAQESLADNLPVETLANMRDSFRTQADKQWGHAKDGAAPARQSAPSTVKNAVPVEKDGAEATTKWGQLSDTQRDFAAKAFPSQTKTPEQKEVYAANLLGDKEAN